MRNAVKLETERLILRSWTEGDRQPFADMSADRAVMTFLPRLDGRDAADRWIDDQIDHLADYGICFWAIEIRESGILAGAAGLRRVCYDAHFTPAVEVGWRLSRVFWGCGYAGESAAAALRYGFESLELAEICANTVAENVNSRRVMRKLGMRHDAEGAFDHPLIPVGHPLRRQVLYRLRRDRWTELADARTQIQPPR